MGLFGRNEKESEQLEEAGATAKTANAIVGKLMDWGIDGLGPLDSVADVVAKARAEHADPEDAIDAIAKSHVKLSAAGGFVTGAGGLLTMGVALPANIIEFYVLATRMVAGIATVRGYDIQRPEVRSAVMLTLVGADSQDLLRRAGVTGVNRLSQVAIQRLPKAAVMVINKGVGFRLATQLGAKTLGRLGRAVPVFGGIVGAGLDGYLMHRIADHAREEFPTSGAAALGT